MLDPGGAAVRERIGSARDSSFCAPELLQSETAAKGIDWQCDMWSIGVIVHLLLVNTLPRFTGWSGSSPFSSASFSQKTVRFSLEDGWRERSAYSRDFIRRLLCEQRKRPTAAQMLHHPWLRRFAPQGTELWPRMTPEKKGALMAGAAEIQLRLLCFMLAVLLAPVMLQSYEVERLQQIFASKDTDVCLRSFCKEGCSRRMAILHPFHQSLLLASLPDAPGPELDVWFQLAPVSTTTKSLLGFLTTDR
eukprot:gnl/TRDRNA2_/TRDRNA2_150062_c0_seq1.p1 gnl/TRDRNA2_/TRDRNA2_150062_c0~~gnl/TRDRNA2_/TRDRNA2_150062_c0_seq1.p1  ORF type:complete len:269 (-),score=45.96 gnl/TRDRNA2_/TRDRNA2_150062_c0_seq1:286-1029(-)